MNKDISFEEFLRKIIEPAVHAVRDAGYKYFTDFGSEKDQVELIPVKIKE